MTAELGAKWPSAYVGGPEALARVAAETVPALVESFGDAVQPLETPFETPQVLVRADAIADVAGWLKDRGFNMLLDIGGADYFPREPRFEVVYHFFGLPSLGRLRVRVQLADDTTEVPTLSHLWPSADPAEREVFDQFGIRFKGHPNLTRILNPDDWQGHPLRRDYPMRGPRELNSDQMPAERNRFFPIRLDEGD